MSLSSEALNITLSNEEISVHGHDSDFSDNYEDDLILAIDYKRQVLGGSFYSHRDQKLSLIDDAMAKVPQNQIEQLIDHLTPRKVIVNSTLDREILDLIELKATKLDYHVIVRPSKEFSSKTELDSAMVLKAASTSVQDSEVMIGAMGALLKYVKADLQLNDNNEQFEDVQLKVELFILKDYMYVDRDSLVALQVVPQSRAIRRESKSSLIEILSFTRSDVGKRRLQQWILRPLANLELIRERHDTVSLFLNPDNREVIDILHKDIRRICDISRILQALRTGSATYTHWLKLYDFVIVCCDLFDNVKRLKLNDLAIKLIKDITSLDVEKVQYARGLMRELLDFDVSRELKKPTILDGVDSSLDSYRKAYNEMELVLQQVASDLGKGLPQSLSNGLQVAYIPQLGYLIAVEGENAEVLKNYAANSAWEEYFKTSTTVYFKNEVMQGMDIQYGDTYSLMCDCEIEIIQNLSDEILSSAATLKDAMDCFAQLDSFLALAKVADTFNFVQPEMVEDSVLDISSSRHPIYENCVPSFVPNDIKINAGQEGTKRICIVTGANLSGKSVYLTQVGLIVYLSHIGSFVPAARAKIGLCDRLLTRILSRETVSSDKSTFMMDVQQMQKCLNLATPKSLLLIDEFGKGTDINDGPALFGACLKHLSASDSLCPRVITATHFQELFSDTEISNYLNLHNACFKNMEIVISKDSRTGAKTSTDEIAYLFNLRDGLASGSFGIHCAKICGIDHEIIERAELFMSLLESGENVIKFCNQLTQRESQNLVAAESFIREFIMWDLDTVDELSSKEKLKLMLQKFV